MILGHNIEFRDSRSRLPISVLKRRPPAEGRTLTEETRPHPLRLQKSYKAAVLISVAIQIGDDQA